MRMMQITFLGELSVKKNILSRQRTGNIQDDKTRQTDTTSVSSVSLHHSYMSKYFPHSPERHTDDDIHNASE